MLVERGEDLNSVYKMLVSRIYLDPEHTSSPRGQATREVLNGNIVLANPRARLITSPTRRANYGFGVGEFAWYWTGRNDLEYIERYNTRLRAFSDDGQTLNSAYGRRIFGRQRSYPGGYGQWWIARSRLLDDPDSRQAVIKILEKEDLDRIIPSKDVPCTCTLQFFLRDDWLHMHVHMRSNDVFWGLPYDVFSFTLLQECMALELSEELGRPIGLGEYNHTAGSLHIYERHFADAERICAEVDTPSAAMPPIHSLSSLWRVCQMDPYVSLGKDLPEALRVPEDTAEAWMRDRLVDHWRRRNTK